MLLATCNSASSSPNFLNFNNESTNDPLKIADIFNLSFSSGIYPNHLKTSKVISIQKTDSKFECSNYRPIALVSNIDKILEKLMHKRLSNILDKKKLIYSLKFGFRQNYSTSYALIYTFH